MSGVFPILHHMNELINKIAKPKKNSQSVEKNQK